MKYKRTTRRPLETPGDPTETYVSDSPDTAQNPREDFGQALEGLQLVSDASVVHFRGSFPCVPRLSPMSLWRVSKKSLIGVQDAILLVSMGLLGRIRI